RIGPSDRVKVTAPVDASKQGLLIETGNLNNRPRFPEGTLDKELSAVVDMGCTVQSDGSLVCTEFKVTPSTKYDAAFSAEAVKVALGVRFAPTLKDGTPSAAVGYRTSVEFRIDK